MKLLIYAFLVSSLVPLHAASDEPLATMAPDDMVSVEVPLRLPFATLGRTPIAKGRILVQVRYGAPRQFAIWEITLDGRVAAVHDPGKIHEKERAQPHKFTADSTGNIYLLSFTSSDDQPRPAVYVLESGRDSVKEVVLSKQLEPRQLVVTDTAWFVAGYTQEMDTASNSLRSRQVLYQFKPDGEFVREVALSGPTTEASSSANQQEFIRQADISYLFGDPSGSLYLVQPLEAPMVFRFDATGELEGKRELPKLAGTVVTNAFVDDLGQLVLERSTVRAPMDPTPENPVRRLMVLNASTLETVLEAALPDDLGGLAAASDGTFYFLKRTGPLDLNLMKASVR